MDIPLFPPKDHHSFFPPPTQPLDTSTTSRGGGVPDSAAAAATDKWAAPLLRECARAIADKDTARIHHLLWMLNELSSPYGDSDQKLAAYFLQALFCRATRSGPRCHRTLSSVADRSHSFDSARKHVLKFQEVSPWTTFGHVAANGAILEALDGEPRIHIIDLGSSLCTQWPTLLESLATRHDDTPHLTLTVVVPAAAAAVMKEIGQRMEKFARLMGVPFEFRAVAGRLADLTGDQLALAVNDDSKLAGAAVAVNCVGAMRKLPRGSDRAAAIEKFRSLSPRVVTVVEEEADFAAGEANFVGCFEECLRYYTVYFDMLEESFAATSNERLMLERESGRNMVRVLACDDDGGDGDGNNDAVSEWERRERGRQWAGRMREGGFAPVGFSDDVIDDVKALLKRYRTGWELVNNNNNNNGKQDQGPGLAGVQQQGGGGGGGDSNLFLNHGFDHNEGNNDHGNGGGGGDQTPGLFLTWKDEPVVWASAWKP